MFNPPKISVLMSVYNGKPYLSSAVESIIKQTFEDFEFIIVDDGSVDGSSELLDNYAKQDRRIKVIHQDNQGLTKSLNRCLLQASGTFIARIDADDYCLHDRLEVQINIMENDPDLVVLGSSRMIVDGNGNYLRTNFPPLTDLGIRWHLLYNNCFYHSSVIYRGDILRKNDLTYDENHLHSQDYALWSKLLNYGKGRNILQPLIYFRSHQSQISILEKESQLKCAQVIALDNLAKLNLNISLSALNECIRLFNSSYEHLVRSDWEYIHLFYIILQHFQEIQKIDPDSYKRLKIFITDRIIYSYEKQRIFSRFVNSPVFKGLWEDANSDLLSYLPRRGVYKIRKYLKQTQREIDFIHPLNYGL